MNALDLILIFPLIWAGFRGFKNGLITEVVSIAALVGGIYLALHYTDNIAQYIHNDAAQLIACALIFGGVLLGGYLGGLLAKKITAIPDLLDKILGIVLGVAKVLALVLFTQLKTHQNELHLRISPSRCGHRLCGVWL